MAFVMLVAGIGLVVAGLLAIGFGIPIKEFSTGNTLIMAGAVGVCTGVIMLGLWVAVRELKNIARRIGTGLPVMREESAERPAPSIAAARETVPANGGFPAVEPFGGPDAFPSNAPPDFPPEPPPPWQNEAVLRDHPIPEPLHPEPPPSPAAAKPKRNLMFSSTSRRERERAQTRPGETPPDLMSSDLRSRPPVLPPIEPAEPPQAPFEDAWPRVDRARPAETSPPRRGGRMPPSLEANATPARGQDQSEVMVLKSGIVDGMAYSLYSDGSIEAEMPEGLMRFASIDELRVHLDQRS